VKNNLIALKTFFNIMKKWNVSSIEQRVLLGSLNESIFFGMKEGKDIEVTEDVLMRISYTLGIYKSLATFFQNEAQANRWINAANQAFNNDSALQYMTEIEDNIGRIQAVRRYLDSQLV
jgi:dynactin complex subunit